MLCICVKRRGRDKIITGIFVSIHLNSPTNLTMNRDLYSCKPLNNNVTICYLKL